MKRRIAAVLMADAAGLARALAEDEPAAVQRVADHRAVIEDIVRHGGGRVLPAVGEALLAVFQSAVQAVRAAVEVQETLRARNRALSLAERLDYRLAITIGEVADDGEGGGEVSPETLAGAAHLVSRAAPGGVCISRSVREAVANKITLKFHDMTVDGTAADMDTPSTYRVASEHPEPPARRPGGWAARARAPGALAAAAVAGLVLAGALAVAVWPTARAPTAPPVAAVEAPLGELTVLSPQAPGEAAVPRPRETLVKPAPGSGRIEFLPGHAPDPSAVLTARRMMPKAWSECRAARGTTAVTACKTLLDSGIPKDGELAEIQLWNGQALRDGKQLDKAIEAYTASLAAKQTAAAYAARGTAHYDKGSWDPAIADYSSAIRLDATNGEAFNNRAWTFYRAGRARDALADADAAVRLLAKTAYVWDTRAHIHAELGNREAAIRDFRAALTLDPEIDTSKKGLARLGVN